MELWWMWLEAIRSVLVLLSSNAGLGLGGAIVAGTVLLRTALLPLTWSIAYRGALRQRKLLVLQPQLQRLRDKFADRPDVYVQRMTDLYREHGLTLIDGRSLLGTTAQLPILLGMFQALRGMGEGIRFLWVPNLLRPDALLALIAGVTTALMMAVNPDMPEQMRTFFIVVPTVIAVVAALQFSSALALYWTTSNLFSALQTVVLHAVVRRRDRAGSHEVTP